MLEKPNISDSKIIECLSSMYNLDVISINFLPVGNDANSFAYAVNTNNQSLYLKLRGGDFHRAIVAIPKILQDKGIRQVIPPLPNNNDVLWVSFGSFNLSLYPFIEGKNGISAPLNDEQWVELGGVLKGLHSTKVPIGLAKDIPREDLSPKWRNATKAILDALEKNKNNEKVAVQFIDFLRAKQQILRRLVEHAEQLSQKLKGEQNEFVLCHGDIHARNVLTDVNGKLYVVDWDTLIFAPKERDLMFIGGGVGGAWNKPEEEKLFYRGYGKTTLDPTALAYYRYERIVEDVVAFSQRLLETEEGGNDRENLLKKFENAFLPNDVIDIAFRTYP